MKKIICLLTVFLLSISMIYIPASADSTIKVFLNGTQLQFDVPPQTINDRTMVPMRTIFEALGAKVEWIGETQSIVAVKGDITVKMQSNSNIMLKNNEQITLEVAPQLIDGRTLVPARAIAESFGADVQWSEAKKSISIQTIGVKVYPNYPNVPDLGHCLNLVSITTNVNETLDTEVGSFSVIEAFVYSQITLVDIENYKKVLAEMSYTEIVNDTAEDMLVYINNNKDTIVALSGSNEGLILAIFNKREQITMYAPDGRTLKINESEIEDYKKVGWYLEPVCTMYATDGRTIIVKNTEAEVYKNVGWYSTKEEVTQTLYSMNGSISVYKDQINSYIDQGWRTMPYSITFTPTCSFEENSADGIELVWEAKNTSGKTINYYHVTLYFVNPVGDPAYEEITGKSSKRVNYVGPVAPDKTLIIYDIVAYSGACDRVIVGEVEIEYADGTTETLWCGQVAKEGNILSKWDGTMI